MGRHGWSLGYESLPCVLENKIALAAIVYIFALVDVLKHQDAFWKQRHSRCGTQKRRQLWAPDMMEGNTDNSSGADPIGAVMIRREVRNTACRGSRGSVPGAHRRRTWK